MKRSLLSVLVPLILSLSSCAPRQNVDKIYLLICMYEHEIYSIEGRAKEHKDRKVIDDASIQLHQMIIDLLNAGCKDTIELESLTSTYLYEVSLAMICGSLDGEAGKATKEKIGAWVLKHKPVMNEKTPDNPKKK